MNSHPNQTDSSWGFVLVRISTFYNKFEETLAVVTHAQFVWIIGRVFQKTHQKDDALRKTKLLIEGFFCLSLLPKRKEVHAPALIDMTACRSSQIDSDVIKLCPRTMLPPSHRDCGRLIFQQKCTSLCFVELCCCTWRNNAPVQRKSLARDMWQLQRVRNLSDSASFAAVQTNLREPVEIFNSTDILLNSLCGPLENAALITSVFVKW